MIEKTLSTTHGKLSVAIPTTLQELTFGQLMKLQERPDLNDLEAISILSGVPLHALKTVRHITEFGVFANAMLQLSHQLKYLHGRHDIPNYINFRINKRLVRVKVLNNLSIEPAGAFMAASDIIADEISEHIKKYGEDTSLDDFVPSLNAQCRVLAHYFYGRVTNKRYDEYAAEEFTEEIKKLPVAEALAVSRHFFSCYPNLCKPKTAFWQPLYRFWKKKQASPSLKGSAMSTRSIHWQGAISPNGPRY